MTRSLALLPLAVLALPSAAQDRGKKATTEPRPLYATPLVVVPGATTKLTVRGLNFDGLTTARADEPKTRAKLLGAAKKLTLPNALPASRVGDWEAEVEVSVPAEVPGGTLSFSVVGPGGASKPIRVAVADGTPRVAETEPNDALTAPQAVPWPCVIEGTIGRNQDADVFRFAGKAGDRVRLRVQAAALGSPADLVLTVYDADRRVLAVCDDANGSADPDLTLALPADGNYTAAVIDAHDLGGPPFAYRLHVSRGR